MVGPGPGGGPAVSAGHRSSAQVSAGREGHEPARPLSDPYNYNYMHKVQEFSMNISIIPCRVAVQGAG